MILAPLCQGPLNYDYVAPSTPELHFKSNCKFQIQYLTLFIFRQPQHALINRGKTIPSHVKGSRYLCRHIQYLCLKGLGLFSYYKQVVSRMLYSPKPWSPPEYEKALNEHLSRYPLITSTSPQAFLDVIQQIVLQELEICCHKIQEKISLGALVIQSQHLC